MDINTLFGEGIYKNGYGIIPQSVMRHKGLSATSKALYAYICSFAGKGTTAFPSLELICSELGISEKKMYQCRKELIENKLINISKVRTGKKYSNNIYTIIINPENKQFEPSKNEPSHFEPTQNNQVQESEENSQFLEPGKNGHVQFEQGSKVGTNNNIYINNNIYSANKELIEEIWAMYPNKKGKTKSLEYISKILKKISADELKRCVIRYSKEVKGKDKQYILNGSTFFHTRYADYLDSEYESINTENNYRTTKPSKPKYIPVLMEDM